MTSRHLPGLALLPGSVVCDRFKVLREIGNGMTASVLLARDLDTKQRVAIKTAHLTKKVRSFVLLHIQSFNQFAFNSLSSL